MIGIRHTLALGVTIAAVLAAVPFGCREVLGIESRGSDALTCDAYCSSIATACTAADGDLQYAATAGCLALCATFPVGTLEDDGVNTLGCRIRQTGLVENGAEGVCAAAGPGGDALCGLNCQSFCHSAVQVCPTDFDSEADCLTKCADIPDCSSTAPYSVNPNPTVLPNENSLQCRLYHLTAATLDPMTHCPHVLGIGYCSPSLPPACGGDAGAGSEGDDGGDAGGSDGGDGG